MYQIFADGTLIYDSRYEEYVITKGQISKEVNKSGSFVFTIYQDNPYYNQLEKLKTIITVYRDGSLIFRGRIIDDNDGFYNDKTFTCEGELSFLLDSIKRPYTYTGSPSQLFTRLIETHNEQVAADKQFTVGEITVEDPNDYINRQNTAYEDTLTNINTRLLEPLGGYINITHDSTGAPTINWIDDFPYLATQSIEFGENLLDFTKKNDASSIITALIPLGSKIEGSNVEARVTIESVNGGVDYIFNQAAVNKYGWIFGVEIWDDVTEPSNLLTKGQTYLNEMINLDVSIELTAIDLSNMDKNISAFELGDYVQVISAPHGIDAKYLLTKQEIDLLHAENNKITLGYTFSTFTDTTLSNTNTGTTLNQKVETIESNYVTDTVLYDEVEALKSMISQASDSITMEVLQEYATNDEVTTAIGTLYTQLKDSFEFVFTEIETTINSNDANTRQEFEEIRKYIRFQDGNIILGESDSELTAVIENDQIVFYDNAEQVAYISNHKLYITDAEILTSIIIGNYAFIPRDNGNLSFKKVRGS